MTLTSDHRRTFDERGLVRLPGLVPVTSCAQMADRLWAEMERKDGVRRDAPESWTVERPAHFRKLLDTGAFADMAPPAVRAVLDALMGQDRWEEPAPWGLPLICFPNPGRTWAVPYQNWHLDGPVDPGLALVGRVFLILEPLRPQGGGSLVALGSHLLARRLAEASGAQLSSAEVRKRLKAAHPWFAALMSPPAPDDDRTARFMDQEERVDGVACQVAEMTGEPGDVWLMHPNILHNSAPNALETPRLALTQFVAPKG